MEYQKPLSPQETISLCSKAAWPGETLSAPVGTKSWDTWGFLWHQINQADQNNNRKDLKIKLPLETQPIKFDQDLRAKTKQGDCLLK